MWSILFINLHNLQNKKLLSLIIWMTKIVPHVTQITLGILNIFYTNVKRKKLHLIKSQNTTNLINKAITSTRYGNKTKTSHFSRNLNIISILINSKSLILTIITRLNCLGKNIKIKYLKLMQSIKCSIVMGLTCLIIVMFLLIRLSGVIKSKLNWVKDM